MSQLKIQLSQLNFTVGDLDGNCQKIIAAHKNAREQGVDLVVFSELAITGYPPEDLLHKKYFLDEVEEKIAEIKTATLGSKTAILLGAPHFVQGRIQALYNSALLIENGEVIAIANKTCLPNYGVFDEHRYFKPAPTLSNIEFRGFRLVVLICEDIWHLKNAFLLNDKVFDAIISINASPFNANKAEKRLEIVRKFIKDLKKPVIYLNQIGCQDSILFDGGSFVLSGDGEVVLPMKEFEEDSGIISLCHSNSVNRHPGDPDITTIEVDPDFRRDDLSCRDDARYRDDAGCVDEADCRDDVLRRVYSAAILGLRDYIHKNNFKQVLIGMSGGIDSALVAAIAVDALASENVKLVAMPTKYNSQTSMDDALKASENLGVKLEVINIQNAVEAINQTLAQQFADTKKDTTEENIQSRIRGNILMALSNKFGHLLLSTGNKSELAVGYATIYGDMCGAFNPLKDIYKTEVFELAKWRNSNIPAISIYQKINLIPQNIIQKAPTAELRENQKDSDSLPEYDVLDKILHQLIEEEKSVAQIIEVGFEENLVKKIAKLFFNSEYKRRQAVLGVKVSEKSFDKDRRYPITNHFKH